MIEYPKFKVTVSCMTYNQAKYITDALNGFTMQQTSFPFICTIVDDASTDGEQEVIRRYVEEYFDFSEGSVAYHKETDYAYITYAQHKTNKNCYFAVLYLKENLYLQPQKKDACLKEWRDGIEYKAFCEGDDCWIVPDKLEKQVVFLDEHKEYVLVHTDFIAQNSNTGKIIHNASSKYKIVNGDVFERLFEGCFIRTVTVCYRNSYFDEEQVPLPKDTFGGDLYIFYVLARKGKIFFQNEETCIYRVLQESASHSNSEGKRILMSRSYKNLDYYIANYYGVENVLPQLDCKWFKIDLRNCIATKDFNGVRKMSLPETGISTNIKILYYCCKSKILMYLLSLLLSVRRRFLSQRWF